MYELSVIIPVYNVVDWLPRCINSIIEQNVFEKVELILIDDGSIDGSSDLCDRYAFNYKNIIAFHKSNGGVSSARNLGLNNATGKYVVFVDADDYVEPYFLDSLLICAEQSNADLVVSDYYLSFPNGQKIRYRSSNKTVCWGQLESLIEFLKGGNIGVNLFDKLFIRNMIGDLRFDEKIKIGEDLYFIFQYLTSVSKVCGDFTPGYNYYQREGSAMKASFSMKYFDVIDVSERILEWIKNNKPEIIDYAEAMYIHSAYKTIERCYKADALSDYRQEVDILSRKVHLFPVVKAWKNLSKKQFLGFILIRFSPKLYVFVCRLMKI